MNAEEEQYLLSNSKILWFLKVINPSQKTKTGDMYFGLQNHIFWALILWYPIIVNLC